MLSLAESGPTTVQFFDGGSAYNAVNFYIGVGGIIVSVVGLWIAIVQISKARSAAEAAKRAATDTANQLQKMDTLLEVSALCALARELISHLTNKDYKTAAVRALDLRGGIANAKNSPKGRDLQGARKWQELAVQVGSIHDSLSDLLTGDGSDFDRGQCIRVVCVVYEKLAALASNAVPQPGEANADSRGI